MGEIQQLNKQIIQSAQEGIIVYGPDLRYRIWNPFMEAFTGLPASEVLGKHPLEFFPFLKDEGVIEQLENILAGESAVLREFPFQVPSTGRTGWALDVCSPLRDHRGEVIGVIGLVQDITDRKQTELAIMASEAKFRSFVENAPDGIFVTDRDQNYRLVNPAACAMTGYTAEEFAHMTIRDLVPEGGVASAKAAHDQLVEDGRVSLEVQLRRKDGSIFWVALDAVKIDENQLLAFCKDISERKQAEVQLRQAQNQIQKEIALKAAIVDCSDDAIIGKTLDGYVTSWNRGAEQIFGYSEMEMIGTSILRIVPSDRTAEEETVLASIRSGRLIQHYETERVRKDGKLIPVSLSVSPIRDNNGEIIGASKIVRDTTERKRAEENQRLLEAQLQQTQKLKSLGTLVAGVAHNINNVLSIIMGTASLREDGAAQPSDGEAYQIIRKACNRGREVVNSLIHFAQPAVKARAPFELNNLINDVCALLETTSRNQIKIEKWLIEDPLWINGSAGDIDHILVNLGINSLDAMPDGGILTFRTNLLEGNWVEVSIEDNGTGMTPEVLASVLDPFFTTKEVGQGTGLGLSMTYGIVKAHGGTIDIASQPGQGTQVKVRFPRIQAPAVESEPAPVIAPMLSLNPMKVFLVDDDEDVRFLMHRMLKKAGVHQVKVFPGGKEMLEVLSLEELPDLIILDQNMPGLTGSQTMERIRALHPEMPILISSGQPGIREWDRFKLPKVAVISKPFTFDEIQAKLAQFAWVPRAGVREVRGSDP